MFNFRYDPSSKCFSYVPAKSLKEHYKTAPKKKSSALHSKAHKSELDLSSKDNDSRKFEVIASDLTHRSETPKWENEIDKVCKFTVFLLLHLKIDKFVIFRNFV